MFYCTSYEDLQVPLFDVMEQQQPTSYFGQMMVRNVVGSSSGKTAFFISKAWGRRIAELCAERQSHV